VTGFHAWGDVKREVFEAEDLDAIDAGAQSTVAEARAHRLAEMRRLFGLTQSEVAARMHVRQERVSAIERGNAAAAEVGTVAAYIAALGGQLEIIASFVGTRSPSRISRTRARCQLPGHQLCTALRVNSPCTAS